VKSEREIRAKLEDLQDFCKKEEHVLEQMQGEVQILKFVWMS
jgi:hypothetical protein